MDASNVSDPGWPVPQDEAIDFLEYWGIIYFNRWFIAAITLAVLAGSAIYYSTLPNVYSANTKIVIERIGEYSKLSQHMQLPDTDIGSYEDVDYYETQVNILKGSKIAGIVASELGKDMPPYDFKPSRVRKTSIIILGVACGNPEWAARIANKYAEVFMKQSSNEQFYIAEQLLKYIPDEIEAGGQLSKSLLKNDSPISKLTTFNKNLFAESINSITMDPVVEKLRNEKLDVESKLDEMLQRYLPDHPDVMGMQDRLNKVDKKLKERTQILLDNVRATLSGQMQVSNVRVFEEARAPRAPSSPKRFQGILMATLGALFLSSAFFALSNQLNLKVSVQKDLTALSLTFLGYVPTVKAMVRSGESQNVSLVSLLETERLLTDAIVSVRTHILFSVPYEQSKRIMITSAVPDEGKTTISILLALSLAALGRKILWIDADMRKSVAMRYLPVEKPIGLADYLMDKASLEEVIQTVPGSSLKVISAGSVTPLNAPELLSSQAFQKLLEAGNQAYDRLVVDVPPALHIADALIVAKHVHTGVLVCRSGTVYKKTIKMIKEKFDSVNLSLVGVVINRANYEKDDYYHKGYHKYYKDYAKGDLDAKSRLQRWRFADKPS